MQGFEQTLHANVIRVCLAEQADQAALLATLQQSKPDMVAAIGSSAAAFATRHIRDIPVIYFMVMNPDQALLQAGNVHGVVLNQNPVLMLDSLRDMGIAAARIGTISSSLLKPSFALEQLSTALKQRGLKLNLATVSGVVSDLRVLDTLLQDSDAIILIPDQQAITARTYKYLVERSRQLRIPLLVPTGLLVKVGGLLSFNHDAADIGRQAAEMANSILDGDHALPPQPQYARHNALVINRTTAKWNRLRLPRSMQLNSRIYD